MNGVADTPTTTQIYKVALASIVDPIVEQYDFLVTGVIAATVRHPHVLHEKLPNTVSGVGRERRLPDFAGLWRWPDSDCRGPYSALLRG